MGSFVAMNLKKPQTRKCPTCQSYLNLTLIKIKDERNQLYGYICSKNSSYATRQAAHIHIFLVNGNPLALFCLLKSSWVVFVTKFLWSIVEKIQLLYGFYQNLCYLLKYTQSDPKAMIQINTQQQFSLEANFNLKLQCCCSFTLWFSETEFIH